MSPRAGRTGRDATARGDQRRGAIVEAASALLEEQGFAAVSHRAVAARAEVPLSATTYYFASREELVREALDVLGERYLAQARELTDRPLRGPLARRVIAMIAGTGDAAERDALLTLYERYVQAGRTPSYGDLVSGWTSELVELVARVLERADIADPAPTARVLVGAVDGLLLAALAAGRANPARAIERDVALLLERLG